MWGKISVLIFIACCLVLIGAIALMLIRRHYRSKLLDDMTDDSLQRDRVKQLTKKLREANEARIELLHYLGGLQTWCGIARSHWKDANARSNVPWAMTARDWQILDDLFKSLDKKLPDGIAGTAAGK